MKNVKTAILLTAFLSTILSLSFSAAWAASTYSFRDPDKGAIALPDRPVVLIQNPGIWAHVVSRHSVELKSRIQKQGLEMVRILKFRLSEPVQENQKDKITGIYVLDKDGLVVGFYEFDEGDQEYILNLTAVINFIQVYVECANHGLWRQDIRFES